VVMIDTQATLEAKVPGSSSGARTSTQKKTDWWRIPTKAF